MLARLFLFLKIYILPQIPFNCVLILDVLGLEVGKQRLLSAHLPFLPGSISDRDKMSYLTSCIAFDSPLMVSQLAVYHPTFQPLQKLSLNYCTHHFAAFSNVCSSVG